MAALPSQDPIAAPVLAPLTSFVGRDQEIAVVIELLRRTEIRLLTLTGPDGIGKSRLVRRIVEITQHDDVGGIAFVPETGSQPAPRHGLTPREIVVLRLITAGRSNRAIAAYAHTYALL